MKIHESRACSKQGIFMTNKNIFEITSKESSHPLLEVRVVPRGIMSGQEVVRFI